MANLARGLLESADTTNLSRLLSEAPGGRTKSIVGASASGGNRRNPIVVGNASRSSPDTLGEHVGSLFDEVDRHSNPSDGTSPLAHHPVTGFSVSGPVRFPLGLRLYRRDEELTQWEAEVATHVPDRKLPTENKARNRLHKPVDPVWLQDPEFQAWHEPFRTPIALAMAWVEAAIRSQVPFGVVVFDAGYLAEDVVRVLARRRKDGVSLLNTNRLLETASFQLRDIHGGAMKRPGPPIAVEELVPLIPANAYRPVTVGEHTSWCVTRRVRLPAWARCASWEC